MSALEALLTDCERVGAGERSEPLLQRVALGCKVLVMEYRRQQRQLVHLKLEARRYQWQALQAEEHARCLREGIEQIVTRWSRHP